MCSDIFFSGVHLGGTLVGMRCAPDVLEQVARDIYRAAHADPCDPVSTPMLAARVLGPGAVCVLPPSAILSYGELARSRGRWRIYVRSGTPVQLLGHVVGHELAHWALRREGLDSEAAADWLGAALVLPAPACDRILRSPADVAIVARTVVATQTLVALRLGESGRARLALVAPERVRVRGLDWTEDAARRAAMRPPPGVEVVRLTDDVRRVALAVRR